MISVDTLDKMTSELSVHRIALLSRCVQCFSMLIIARQFSVRDLEQGDDHVKY